MDDLAFQQFHVELPSRSKRQAIQLICWHGKVLPNVYLLGAQKAGTTAMSGLLARSGIENILHFAEHQWQPPG
eukprot:1358890-Amphidinium_carterae.1